MRLDRPFVAEWVIWVHGGLPSVTFWGKSQPSFRRAEIINHRRKPSSALYRLERIGRLHPFLRQPETPLAIFLIFEGKNSPNGFVSVIRKQIG